MRLTTARFLAMAGVVAAMPGAAGAVDCAPPFFAGTWESTAPVVRELVRLEIGYTCRVGRRLGESRIEYDYTMRAWSKCSPRDCPWGAAEVGRDNEGRLVSEYSQFYSRRIVVVEKAGLGLSARVTVDYYDPERRDETYEHFLERD